jgi:RNA-directed DNA polymerase
MEFHLQEFVSKFEMTYGTGTKVRKSRRGESLALVRYADDFVILHHDKKILLACFAEIKNWLSGVGLSISAAKTRLTHTLKLQETDTEAEGFDGVVGFNFLGYTIKQFPSKYMAAHDTLGKSLGFKTLVYVSKKAFLKHQKKLHSIVLVDGKGLSQSALIKTLNPIIRGWANYFGAFDSNTMNFLTKADYWLYLKLRQWSKRVCGTTGKGRSMFHSIGNNKWTFSVIDGPVLLNHWKFATASSRVVKVQGASSPYDGHPKYWTKRLSIRPSMSTRAKFLFIKQKGICTWCKRRFYWDDNFFWR